MLNVTNKPLMLTVFILNVVMLSVTMLNVVEPIYFSITFHAVGLKNDLKLISRSFCGYEPHIVNHCLSKSNFEPKFFLNQSHNIMMPHHSA